MAATAAYAAPVIKFGHALRPLWFFADNFTDMNHGFGGMTPRAVHQAQTEYVVRRESNPRLYGWGCPAGSDVAAARARVAEYIGAPLDSLVLVENAMGGINALLRSWPGLARGSTILLLATGYDGLYNIYPMAQRH